MEPKKYMYKDLANHIDSMKACVKTDCVNCTNKTENDCVNNLLAEGANMIEYLLDIITHISKNEVDKIEQDQSGLKVNHPKHYQGKIECIEYINSLGYGRGFCLGNAIKYIHRAGHKDGESVRDDLEKAAFYIKWYLYNSGEVKGVKKDEPDN